MGVLLLYCYFIVDSVAKWIFNQLVTIPGFMSLPYFLIYIKDYPELWAIFKKEAGKIIENSLKPKYLELPPVDFDFKMKMDIL